MAFEKHPIVFVFSVNVPAPNSLSLCPAFSPPMKNLFFLF